ncbi:TLD-domain-containing protein [Lineolata rhizophorae]|uniref:Restriction of telomere capping protein 5 n=1 Tax=Lineolata rhizophorae TaxID=578093 RepID=A0A6A6NR45_9PEZI|nr:TLD-domain-containing protein [Lineolata rhizophorae]
MGQGGSAPQAPVSIDALHHRLTRHLGATCFTPLELYSLHSLFAHLSDLEPSSHTRYISEPTLARFLALPDALAVAPVLFMLASWWGAWPFPSRAPAILDEAALVRVVVVGTGRAGRAGKKKRRASLVAVGSVEGTPAGREGRGDFGEKYAREVYRGLAVYDRGLAADAAAVEKEGVAESPEDGENDGGGKDTSVSSHAPGFVIDAPTKDDDEDLTTLLDDADLEDDNDPLALAALEAMDVASADAFLHSDHSSVRHSIIPTDNFARLIELLLLIAPLHPQEPLAAYGAQLADPERLANIRRASKAVLAAFGGANGGQLSAGIGFKKFMKAVKEETPHIFEGLGPLFEHFLFSRELDDLHKKKAGNGSAATRLTTASLLTAPDPSALASDPSASTKIPTTLAPLLPPPSDPSATRILTPTLLSQLSFIIPGSDLFQRLRPLYSGSQHGFSMGAFEKHVFKWQAPTLLLVKGELLTDDNTGPRERDFLASLPSRRKRWPCSADALGLSSADTALVYGAFVPAPWKQTPRHPFSDARTALFQLAPAHAVCRASPLQAEYAYFARGAGLGFGSPVPGSGPAAALSRKSSYGPGASGGGGGGGSFGGSSSYGSYGGSGLGGGGGAAHVELGPMSLHLDDGLEFGVFTHAGEGGGSFRPSSTYTQHGRSPPPAAAASSGQRGAAQKGDFCDRFAVTALEVWGCGGAEEAEAQRRAWLWEEAEAERRRRVNLGTGDVEADRELLRLAGIIGGERSGGSMG